METDFSGVVTKIDYLTVPDQTMNFSGLHSNRTVKGGFRVHEVARALGVESKTVRLVAASVGVHTKSPSSMIEPLCAVTIAQHMKEKGWC